MSATRAEPLAGVLVVDLSRHLPGPLAARLLRDLGARVIKVEEPGVGDPVRYAGEALPGSGALAEILLAGVESIALDLKRAPARAALGRFLARADVLLESFRPGTLARLGLAPEELRADYPRLVVCSISGWGEGGPAAARSGHDLTYQALSGALASTASMPGLPAADLLGAWAAVAAILAQVVARRRTGRGAHIDASLLDAAGHGNLTALAAEAGKPRRRGEPLPLTGAQPCYNLYATADGGLVAMAALESGYWERFCAAAERPDLVPLQRRPDAEAFVRVQALFASRSLGEWTRLFERHDLPAAPVLSPAEARAHPQVAHRGLLPDEEWRPGFPACIDGARPRARGGMPAVGADTERLLREFGVES